MLKKYNPFYIGTFFAFISLMIAQIRTENMLSAKVYLVIAVVSLLLVFADIGKSASNTLKKLINETNKLYDKLSNDMQLLLNPYADKKFTTEELTHQKEQLKKKKERFESQKFDLIFKAIDLSIILTYAVIVFSIITIPFKIIPESLMTNRIIGVITILAFAITFLSLSANHYFEYIETEVEKENEKYETEINYIRRIHELKEENKDTGE